MTSQHLNWERNPQNLGEAGPAEKRIWEESPKSRAGEGERGLERLIWRVVVRGTGEVGQMV